MSYGLLRRLSTAARSVVVGASPRRPRPLRLADVQRGWVVVDLAGRRVGCVERVGEDSLIVTRGAFRARVVVPIRAISMVTVGEVRTTLAVDGPQET